MKHFISLLVAVLINSLMGVSIASAAGASPVAGIVGGNIAGAIMSIVAPLAGLRVGVFTEIWTGELVKQLRGGLDGSWLNGIQNHSAVARHNVIHMVDVGVDPDVLVNNKTYPIATQELADNDIAISLDKFQTKATPITDDELHAASYDKIARVREAHGNALTDRKFSKAAHALAPSADGDKTPVVATSGEAVSATDKRRRIAMADIVALKAKFDALKVPVQGRRLVLCPDHVNDLLLLDQKFADQYYNYTTGKIANLYGFEVYEYVGCPYFTAAGKKGALDSTSGHQASVAFYAPRVFVADGETKMYYSEAKTDPLNQRNLVNFRHYSVIMPKKQEAIGAIYSAEEATTQG